MEKVEDHLTTQAINGRANHLTTRPSQFIQSNLTPAYLAETISVLALQAVEPTSRLSLKDKLRARTLCSWIHLPSHPSSALALYVVEYVSHHIQLHARTLRGRICLSPHSSSMLTLYAIEYTFRLTPHSKSLYRLMQVKLTTRDQLSKFIFVHISTDNPCCIFYPKDS